MSILHEKLAAKIPLWRDSIRNLLKEHGDKVISTVTVEQAYGGMRGVKALVCDTSLVPPKTGVVLRGIPIGQLQDKLPEEIFFLLLTGELPDQKTLKEFQKDLEARSNVPGYVWDVLKSMPKDSHPMTMLSTAILVMQKESIFKEEYNAGINKEEYWKANLEDALNIMARIQAISAGIYRMRFNKGDRIPSRPDLDWGGNYAHMMGIPDPSGEFANLMRLFFTLHSDHEGGNASALTSHTVSSTLSDLYFALSAGLNALSGPLHGLANQEVLKWILMVQKKHGGVPTDEQMRKFAWDTLNAGHVIPGYGHAVLRITDPRFDAIYAFGSRVCPNDQIFQIVKKTYDIVPKVLTELGKVKDPWPNVDAISGALLYHFGMHEFDYYTVLFAVSRALGVCTQGVISRAMGYPILRPKSVTTEWLQKEVTKK
jgi:citrate synthase